MLVNPYIFGGSVGSWPLDAFTSGLECACALQRLFSSWSGSLIRVRRSSDNAEQDIGYLTLGGLDEASLASFVGANDGFVTKMYDQSGGGNHLVQATSGAQPQIVFAGVVMPDILTDGVDDKLVTTSASSVTTGSAVFLGGRIRGLAAASAQGYTYGRTDLAGPTIITSSGAYKSNTAAGSLIQPFDTPPTRSAEISCVRYDLTEVTDTNRIKYFLNGAQQTGLTLSGATPANLGSYVTYVGCDGSGAAGFAKLALRSFVLYGDAALSSGNIGTISTALRPAPMPVDALQSYTTNLWSATSHTRTLSGYSGSVIRVRRSSDNAEQDIGTVAGAFDVASLATFCAGTNGFVTKRYDQSGSGNDWVQATSGNQPKVYDSSTGYLGHESFDGSNDSFSTGNSGTPAAVTIYLRGKLITHGTNVVLEHSTNYNLNDSIVSYFDSGTYTVATHKLVALGASVSNFTENFSDTVACLRSDRAQVTGAAQSALLAGGRLVTRSGSGDSGVLPSGNMSAQPWYLGGRAGSSLFTQMDIDDVVIYETAHSDATANLVSYLLGG